MVEDRGGAPTDKVWAIYYLYAQQFPVVISLNQRAPDDENPYIVTIGEGLEEFTQRYLMGQRRSCVKKVQRHEHDGWYVQTDSKFCERIKTDHKSNHVWFSIRSGRISQRCFDEECREFHGQEHILPPSIVEQLKDVAVVGSPISNIFMDIFPDGPKIAVQQVRKYGPSVLGSGPGKLEEIFRQPTRF